MAAGLGREVAAAGSVLAGAVAAGVEAGWLAAGGGWSGATAACPAGAGETSWARRRPGHKSDVTTNNTNADKHLCRILQILRVFHVRRVWKPVSSPSSLLIDWRPVAQIPTK